MEQVLILCHNYCGEYRIDAIFSGAAAVHVQGLHDLLKTEGSFDPGKVKQACGNACLDLIQFDLSPIAYWVNMFVMDKLIRYGYKQINFIESSVDGGCTARE